MGVAEVLVDGRVRNGDPLVFGSVGEVLAAPSPPAAIAPVAAAANMDAASVRLRRVVRVEREDMVVMACPSVVTAPFGRCSTAGTNESPRIAQLFSRCFPSARRRGSARGRRHLVPLFPFGESCGVLTLHERTAAPASPSPSAGARLAGGRSRERPTASRAMPTAAQAVTVAPTAMAVAPQASAAAATGVPVRQAVWRIRWRDG